MSKRGSNYPRDEFDPVPNGAVHPGVHRTPRSPWQKLWPFLLTVVLCAALGVGAIYFFTQNPNSRVTEALSEAASSSTADEEPAEEEPADEEPAEEEPADEEPADEEPAEEEPAEEEPAAEVDRSVSIRVLNAGAVAGQAGEFASKLQNDGFTSVEAANFEGDPPTGSLIYYLGADNLANAERVGEVLGITNLQEVEALRADISVVIR
ncbi:LytR C-terminal domain-containing protein [Jonesia quinghaiensis]|uniref:LytR C-terminal domain-containing protein n=1 Tax=Jonesia quinghaiensis TaxID=262806 RepID=UPI00048E7553|nr:LytR C-terminal domain-containing protein [Jonesia quinghaiensis]